MMVQGQANIQTHTVMAGMVAIGLVGLTLDTALRLVERLILRRRGMEH
jgi:NitT/TauT family transport system permease protein